MNVVSATDVDGAPAIGEPVQGDDEEIYQAKQKGTDDDSDGLD